MEFADYLWELAHIVFKRKWNKSKSDIYKTFTVVGSSCDQLKQDIFNLRENALLYTATGEALDFHGKDRNISRYAGETDEEYRNRLLAAAEVYSLEGTLSGMIAALERLGYTGVEVYELYKEKYTQNPNPDYVGRWAEFIIKLNNVSDTAFLEHSYKILKSEINKVKRAATKLYSIAYITKVQTTLNLDNSIRIGQRFETGVKGLPIKLDSTKKLDGTWKLDNKAIAHSLQIKVYKNNILITTTDC